MSFRNTIIALVVLAIVGGYALIVHNYSKPEEAQKLFQVKADDIAKIELRYPDRDIVIERPKSGLWHIAKPIGADADQTAANNLARAIADCEITKTVDEKPADIAPFGLANPAVIVTITTFANKTFPGIMIGKTTPVGFSAYIRTTDKPAVMLTSSAFPPGMTKTVDQLRNRDLMSFRVDDVQKLALQKDNGQTIEVDREGDNFKIVKPVLLAADSTQVRQVLSSLVNAKIADFISDAPANVSEYGLEKPHVIASVYLGKHGEQSLLFGFKQTEQGKDGVYVRRGERAPVYTVHQYILTQVNKSLLDLRDKTVLGFQPSNVESVSVKGTSGPFALKRAPRGKWLVVVNGKASDADVAVVERFLDQIRDLKGMSIIADPMPSAAPFGLDNPAIDITVDGKDGKPIGEVKLAKVTIKPSEPPAPGEVEGPRTEYYATGTPGKAVYSLSDFSYGELNKSGEQFLASPPPPPTAAPTASK